MIAPSVHPVPLSRRRRAGRFRLAGLAMAAALLALLAPAAVAQPVQAAREAITHQAPANWFPADLPGTAEGLSRAMGLDTTIQQSRLMLELVRLAHAAAPAQDRNVDLLRQRLFAYLDAVEQVQDILARIDRDGRGVTLDFLRKLKRDEWNLFAASLGFESREPTGAMRVALSSVSAGVERRRLLELAGIDPSDVAARLNRGEAVRISFPAVQVPLPLSPAVWTTRVLDRRAPARRLGTAILRDRSAALLYYGLAALDAETLACFSTSTSALESARAFAPVFAGFGRSLHVRDRRILLPGGDAAVDLWEQLVGAKASDPDRFVRHLLERDAGSLASFYDMVAHLDPLGARFVLEIAEKDPGQRASRLAVLYSACRRVDRFSQPLGRAFYRPSFESGVLFRQLRLKPDGTMAPPASRRLWELVFADVGIPGSPAEGLRDAARGGDADAAFLAEALLVDNPVARRLRVETVLFAQRMFSRIADDQLADALATLRGFMQYRTLMLTLERIGVSDPATYAAATRSASRFEGLGSLDRQFAALGQFQGTVALIDRLTSRHSLSRPAARKLVGTLLTLVPSVESGGYDGQIARFLEKDLLPLLPTVADEGSEAPLEARLLSGLAGPLPGLDQGPGLDPQAVEWEELRYRVDYATPELGRLQQVRQKQNDNSLDTALALASVASTLAGGRARVESFRTAAAELDRLSKVLMPIFPGGVGDSDGRGPERASASAAERLARLTGSESADQAAAIGRGLLIVANRVLGDALMSIVYATVLGDPDGLPLLGGNPARLHDFGLDRSLLDLRRTMPWMYGPEGATVGVPWHLSGTLLGLDLPLGRLVLRRVSSEPPSGPPCLSPNDARILAHTVALMDPSDFRNADREMIVKAIRRGERRVAALVGGEEPVEAVIADAGLSEWRRNLLRWKLAHEPEAVSAEFSLAELLWLGRPELPPEALNPWGVSAASLSGCMCLRFPPPGPWDELTGHPADGQLATAVPDLALRMAQVLEEFNLPASLVPAVLVPATADVIDEARLAGGDDWLSLVRFIRSISPERVEDYIAMLTALGPLVPLADGPGPSVERSPLFTAR